MKIVSDFRKFVIRCQLKFLDGVSFYWVLKTIKKKKKENYTQRINRNESVKQKRYAKQSLNIP